MNDRADRLSAGEMNLGELADFFVQQLDEQAHAYLKSRGLRSETIARFQIGAEPNVIGFISSRQATGMMTGRVTIPIHDLNGKVVDIIGRATDDRLPKYKSLTNYSAALFGAEILSQTDVVVLCGGLFDALSLLQSRIPGVAVPDCFSFNPQHAALLANKQVFLCFSNDESGRRETLRIGQLLKSCAAQTFVVGLPQGVRDVNDLFVQAENPAEVFQALLQQAAHASLSNGQPSDAHYLDMFLEEFDKRKRRAAYGTASGLRGLDEALGGGLFPGLYLICGEAGSGKTALLRQIVDSFAGQGIPVIHFSYDVTAFQLWATSIAQQLEKPFHDVFHGLIPEAEMRAATSRYKPLSERIWTVECHPETAISDVVETIRQIVPAAGVVPCIVVDPVDRLLPDDPAAKWGLPPANRMEWALYQLHQIARELGTIVLSASQWDKPQRSSDSALAAADVVLKLDWDGEQAEHRSGRLIIEKNRYGETGSCAVAYHPGTLCFSDVLVE